MTREKKEINTNFSHAFSTSILIIRGARSRSIVCLRDILKTQYATLQNRNKTLNKGTSNPVSVFTLSTTNEEFELEGWFDLVR